MNAIAASLDSNCKLANAWKNAETGFSIMRETAIHAITFVPSAQAQTIISAASAKMVLCSNTRIQRLFTAMREPVWLSVPEACLMTQELARIASRIAKCALELLK